MYLVRRPSCKVHHPRLAPLNVGCESIPLSRTCMALAAVHYPLYLRLWVFIPIRTDIED